MVVIPKLVNHSLSKILHLNYSCVLGSHQFTAPPNVCGKGANEYPKKSKGSY